VDRHLASARGWLPGRLPTLRYLFNVYPSWTLIGGFVDLEQLRLRYQGERAENYDRDRVSSKEWQREQEVVERMLTDIRVGQDDVVLDIPVGTGRFLDLYQRLGCQVVGIDVSADMLVQASDLAAQLGVKAELREGDITRIDMPDSSAQTVVCVRIMNLLDWPLFRRALADVTRVSSGFVIAGIQVRNAVRLRDAGWKGALRALRKKTRRSPESRTTTPHPERAVLREFRRRGLAVIRRDLIVASKVTPYYMFLLRKDSTGR
jgi:ubiquinone/menaquinone biosynthesis C-methylase UbiE